MLLIGFALVVIQGRLYRLEDLMRAGELDRRVLIQRRAPLRNEHGEEIAGWVDIATVWAKVERVSGGEEFKAEQRSNRQQVRITIRYRPGIDPTMRAVYDGETYDIEDVGELGRRDGLVLTAYAREVESGG